MSFRSPWSFAVMNVLLDKIEVANGRSVVSITINMASMDKLCAEMSVLNLASIGSKRTHKATVAIRSWIQTTFALTPL